MGKLTDEQRLEIFMKNVDKNGSIIRPELGNCWEWSGLKKEGYGIYSKISAHRFSYMMHKDKNIDNFVVMHICDNRACVNPDHLQIGTIYDNIKDKVSKNRTNKGIKNPYIIHNKFTDDIVNEIKALKDKNININEIILKYNISISHINAIWKGKTRINSDDKLSEKELFFKRAVINKQILHESLGECWETKRDRQIISFHNKMKLSHRVAYYLEYGEIPDGKYIRHKCDNSKCINPNHLEVGTHQDNMNDRTIRNRTCQGVNHHASKLTPESVKEIRKLYPEKTITEISKLFGISITTTSRIINNISWKHVD